MICQEGAQPLHHTNMNYSPSYCKVNASTSFAIREGVLVNKKN